MKVTTKIKLKKKKNYILTYRGEPVPYKVRN